MQKYHTIDGRRCEVKKAISKVEMRNLRGSNSAVCPGNGGGMWSGGGNMCNGGSMNYNGSYGCNSRAPGSYGCGYGSNNGMAGHLGEWNLLTCSSSKNIKIKYCIRKDVPPYNVASQIQLSLIFLLMTYSKFFSFLKSPYFLSLPSKFQTLHGSDVNQATALRNFRGLHPVCLLFTNIVSKFHCCL